MEQSLSPTLTPPERTTFWQRFHRLDEVRFGLLLLSPTLLILLIFLIIPIGYAVTMSFQQIELTISPERSWTGFDNYVDVITERAVRESVGRTFFFAALTIVISVLLALLMALLLNEQFRGRGPVRVLVMLPWAVAPVVGGVLWRYIFQSNYGLANALLYQLGLIQHYTVWLDKPLLALIIAALATAWKSIPFLTLIILAALQSIPESLFRAARMDGAGLWARFRFVTLPHLRNILIFAVVLQIIVSLQTFDLIFTLTRGGPGQGTVVLSFLVFLNAFERLSIGRASALAVLLALLIIGLGSLSFFTLQARQRKA
ncbi:MAG: sugar ABC transporter permease [Caldilineaceae bacterium]|nr:sugar ABC transporter permease [Caldilineaceae bacterium]